MKYDKEALTEMCNKIDLLEYASQAYEFEQRGYDDYAAHCPRHIDETPSLMITKSKNLFHCFSCGVAGNIITWMMVFEKLSFNEAIDKIAALTGSDINHLKKCDALIFYKQLYEAKIRHINTETCDREILPTDYMDRFSDEVPEEWVKEGILPEVMKKYDIRIDRIGNRIVYPVYDSDFNLIGVKGRTRFKNYKEMGLKKYQNYQKIGTTDFFVGMKENHESIIKNNKAIIFEGIKSGMKVEGWGYDYWLASETSALNEEQVKILIKLNIKDVIIAYDNDVSVAKIYKSTKVLRRFVNVYAIIDKFHLLGDVSEKLSPCDKGKEIWEVLLRNKRRL